MDYFAKTLSSDSAIEFDQTIAQFMECARGRGPQISPQPNSGGVQGALMTYSSAGAQGAMPPLGYNRAGLQGAISTPAYISADVLGTSSQLGFSSPRDSPGVLKSSGFSSTGVLKSSGFSRSRNSQNAMPAGFNNLVESIRQ